MITSLVGKPSAGKSTIFKASTLADVAIANYPFTTLKSTQGVAFVRVECAEKEFNVKCNPRFGTCVNGIRFVPIKLMDIPGLIEGSYEGHGMGNQFLADIGESDALINVIDISGSTNEKGEAVAALSYDPLRDVAFIEKELDMWFYGILQRGWEKFARTTHQEKKRLSTELAKQLSGLKVTEEMIGDIIKKLPEKFIEWKEKELLVIAHELRKRAKPMIIAANKIDVVGSEKNLERMREKYPEYLIVPCSADSELALREAAKNKLIEYAPGDKNFKIVADLNDRQKKALMYIKENVLDKFGSTGVQECLDAAAFKLLRLIAIFPGGVSKLSDSEGRVLPDCFLLKDGSTALDFAYRIHSDLGDNFAKAMDVKSKRAVGREHLLKHRDVVEILVNK